MLVDDDEAMLFAFKKLCASGDFEVETASSLQAAVQLLEAQRYDVLIADLNLAGASGAEGLEIIRIAKKHNPSIRAYLWSAYDTEDIQKNAAARNIDGFIDKPVKYETILSLINDNTVSNSSTSSRETT
jgi:DNA-binding NtrC family response regulator